MNSIAPCLPGVRTPAYSAAYDPALVALCSLLFDSLPRSDQRRKGMDYVRGLLEAPGRKSIRNIAAWIGGPATEQSLHHFVSDSTWDWQPVREALTRYVMCSAPPTAWVLRPMVIPKVGQHSVGVDKRFFADLGRVRNAQQAVGVWAACGQSSTPVNWRLYLSRSWLDDGNRRNQASIPDEMCHQTPGDCAVEAYLEMAAWRDLPALPVVLDTRETDVVTTVRRLRAAALPMLIRVGGGLRLTVADPALPGHTADALPARRIMAAARCLRRPVSWTDRATPDGLVAAVRVRLPARPRKARRGDLLLLGAAEHGQPWPARLWLTDMVDAAPDALLRLGRLIHRVDRDFTGITDRVGIRDFAGRSFSGWHRHVTLASAAHALALRTTSRDRGVPEVAIATWGTH